MIKRAGKRGHCLRLPAFFLPKPCETENFYKFCKIVCFFWNHMVYYLRIMMNHQKIQKYRRKINA